MHHDGPKTMNAQFLLLEVLMGLGRKTCSSIGNPSRRSMFFSYEHPTYKRPHVAFAAF